MSITTGTISANMPSLIPISSIASIKKPARTGIRIYWAGQEITGIITSITWAGSAKQSARTLDFDVAYNPDDSNFSTPNIKNGERITMYDGETLIYYGEVTQRQRKGEKGTISYSSKDLMNHFLRIKCSRKFYKKKPEQILKMLCKNYGFSYKSVKATNVKIQKIIFNEADLYNIILKCYQKAKAKTKKQYQILMKGKSVSVIEKGALLNIELNCDGGTTETEYTESTDSMVNQVAIYNSKNKRIGTVKSSTNKSTYGLFQEAISVDSGNGKSEAKAALVGVDKTASYSGVGVMSATSGYGIMIYDKASGLYGKYWIESDTHKFENGHHTMDLELAFKNIMDSSEADTGDSNSSSSSNSDSSEKILNGRKVPALFTAYYPANNSTEGGFYDCKGKKLNPAKKTCAAPSSIKYGNKIQIVGTSKDGDVYTVNDRGGAIKVVNGRYHIDLLMKSNSQCNAWGKKKGYIIIGNGTGYKNSGTSSKPVDKLISKAESFKGKVNYVFGAASPQSGRSDCSGYTQYVFKKAVGKNIGRTTGEQVNAGKKVTRNNLKRGDLVLFKGTYKSGYKYGVSHVGIMTSSNKFIHCSSSGKTGKKAIKVNSLSESYYASHFCMGRRII